MTNIYADTVWGACEAWAAAVRLRGLLPLPVAGEPPPPSRDLVLTDSAIAQAHHAHDAELQGALQAVRAVMLGTHRPSAMQLYTDLTNHATALCLERLRVSHR